MTRTCSHEDSVKGPKATGTSRPSLNDLVRNRQPFLAQLLLAVVHVTHCIHVTLHFALRLLNLLSFFFFSKKKEN